METTTIETTPGLTEWPNSSNIATTQFYKETNTLVVKFKSGAVYQYENFPPHKYEDLLKAESVGRFINQQVKGNYTCKRIA